MRWAHFTDYPSLGLSSIPGAKLLYSITSSPMGFKLGAGLAATDYSLH
jgi:hypothetical protein